MKKTIFLFFALLCSSHAWSQLPAKEKVGSVAFGIYANTNGTGILFQNIRYKEKNDLIFAVSFGSVRNLKEHKIESAYTDQQGKNYFWDKKNYFYLLSPSIGISRELFKRNDDNRMSFRANFSTGPLLGLQKPYFIEIAVPISPTQARVEVAAYDANLYSWNEIVGEADFFYGMSQIKFVPGLGINAAGQIDFSGSKSFIRALEFGSFFNFYFQKPRLMDQGKNKNIFIGASIALLIGNKF